VKNSQLSVTSGKSMWITSDRMALCWLPVTSFQTHVSLNSVLQQKKDDTRRKEPNNNNNKENKQKGSTKTGTPKSILGLTIHLSSCISLHLPTTKNSQNAAE
jgi:hypothetical protein